jgi:hypothetical protein
VRRAVWQSVRLTISSLTADPIPVPVFYVLAIYQDAFRAEKRVIEIRTAEPLSPISKGDYLYEVSFPEPFVALRGHILQLVAKQRIISTHPDDAHSYERRFV